MINETFNYGPFSERAYERLGESARNALLHELGHYVMTKIFIGEAQYSISINAQLREEAPPPPNLAGKL